MWIDFNPKNEPHAKTYFLFHLLFSAVNFRPLFDELPDN